MCPLGLAIKLNFLFPVGTGADFIEEMLTQDEGNRRESDITSHPLLKARKSSTPVPDDKLDEVSYISSSVSYFSICLVLERFSFDCLRTKTKAITLTNRNRRKQLNEPIRTRSTYMHPASSPGKRSEQVGIGFSLTSHWLAK